MAATVVDTSLKKATWTNSMPSDYKDKFKLGDALGAFEALAKKDVTLPADLPTRPDGNIKAIKACVDQMKKDITSLDTAAKSLEGLITALKAVGAAAGKTSSELQKAAKDKQGDDKNKYTGAASTAAGIGAQADAQATKLQGK